MRRIFLLLVSIILSGCNTDYRNYKYNKYNPLSNDFLCSLNGNCIRRIERERFLRLSPIEQQREREKCIQLGEPISCYVYAEPTPEELAKLKNEKK